MNFLNQVTPYNIFLVGVGLVLASLIRIFYDSYREKQHLKKLGHMVKVYNESMDIYEEGVLVISDKEEVIFANKEATRIFGLKHDTLTMSYLKEKVGIRMNGAIDEENFIDTMKRRKNIPQAHIIVGSASIPVSINTNVFQMQYNQDSAWRIIILQDIANKLKLQERLENGGAYKDLLTNLPTRYHLAADLVTVVLHSAQKGHESAVAMFGIRDFTMLQIVHGIEKMDLIMRDIVRDMLPMLQKNMLLYRFECDAFALVFEQVSDKSDARRVLDSIILKIENYLVAQKLKAEMMQGLYFISEKGVTVEKILNDSYRTMRSRSNEKIEILHESPSTLKGEQESTQYKASQLSKSDFLDGIKNKEFFFFYQPIYSLSDDRLIGVEVLTRLNHKKFGFLMADDFMPKAIEFGVMPEITSHLLDNVLGQKKFWANERDMDFDMTINLALSDLQSGVFAEMLEKKLAEYSIDPKTIIIDIPEIVLSEDFDSVSEEFYMLDRMGVRLCIDHFGKGYINLKHLEILPLEAIKIDGSIIKNMTGNEHKTRLASSIISIGTDLGMQVGANHVDRVETKETLLSLGCHFAQGYYFGKAVPAFEITEVINQRNDYMV